jgi:hypothetical protein
VDPVPDPLLLRKSGRAEDRTRDLWICSQKLWPLHYRGGPSSLLVSNILFNILYWNFLNICYIFNARDQFHTHKIHSKIISKIMCHSLNSGHYCFQNTRASFHFEGGENRFLQTLVLFPGYTVSHSRRQWFSQQAQWRSHIPHLPTPVSVGRGFDSRWYNWIFQLILSFQPHYGPGVDSASNGNENQESSWG